jgi:hypothetical protein
MSVTPRKGQEPKIDQEPQDEETIQTILHRVEEKLRQRLRLRRLTIDEIEDQSQDIGEEVKRIVEEESFHSEGTGYCGSHRSCPQGHRARYVGLRCRQLITTCGVQRLSRAYYYCPVCRRGWCPLDQALKLGRGQCSRSVQALIARFASYLPYRTAAQEMEAICGVRLATRTVTRYAQAVEQRLQQEWEQAQQVREGASLPASSERPSRLHATMDGVMTHVDGEWHEVKLGCVYQTDRAGKAVRGRYMATLSGSAVFGRRMRVLGHRSGMDRCRDVAIVADGADWIWQEAGKHFPRSVQVVDYYHVTEHLWEYARVRFGEGKPGGVDWMKEQKERLLSDQLGPVIAQVSAWPASQGQGREVQRKLVNYLEKHQGRLRYKTFREAGYHIGSGVVESGCKNVVQQRMKGSGMRWKHAGAEAQLHLCAHWKSADGRDFSKYTTPATTH